MINQEKYNDAPTVSVIIPTFNRRNTVLRSIASVQKQDYHNYEIIVVDDASSDGTEKLFAGLRDRKIKYIRHQKNKGGAEARNTGIHAAKGEFIAFLDSDDEWTFDKLSKQIQIISESPEKIGAIYSGVIVRSWKNDIIPSQNPLYSGDILSELYARNCVGPLSSVIVKRDVFKECGMFDSRMPSCQDWDLCIRIAQKYHFECVKEPLVNYHLGKKSITKDMAAKAIGHKLILKKYEENICNNRSAYGRQLLTIGHYLCRAGQIGNGRRELLKAVRHNPGNSIGYLYLLCSIFGTTVYNKIAEMRSPFNHIGGT